MQSFRPLLTFSAASLEAYIDIKPMNSARLQERSLSSIHGFQDIPFLAGRIKFQSAQVAWVNRAFNHTAFIGNFVVFVKRELNGFQSRAAFVFKDKEACIIALGTVVHKALLFKSPNHTQLLV